MLGVTQTTKISSSMWLSAPNDSNKKNPTSQTALNRMQTEHEDLKRTLNSKESATYKQMMNSISNCQKVDTCKSAGGHTGSPGWASETREAT